MLSSIGRESPVHITAATVAHLLCMEEYMTSTNQQFSLALEALAELKSDGEITATSPRPVPAVPSLKDVLHDIGPLPREALLLGVASDGLPVLLNLHDPIPGPILVVSDAGAGKTHFLQDIAHVISRVHKERDVQYGVVTKYPDEWKGIEETPHQVGIFPTYHRKTDEFLLSLASWAHGNKNTHQSVLLLVDDLEETSKLDFDAVQNLRWLILRGPSRRVWPVITMNAERYGQILNWIPSFRTRIFGHIKNKCVAEALGGDKDAEFDKLQPQLQFSLREGDHWTRFWIPQAVY